jgi:hypothetical protein
LDELELRAGLNRFVRDHWMMSSALGGGIREYWCIGCDSAPTTIQSRIEHKPDCVVPHVLASDTVTTVIENARGMGWWFDIERPWPLVQGIDWITGLPVPPRQPHDPGWDARTPLDSVEPYGGSSD